MTDIARLALDVDTRKLKAGERDLQGFRAEAGRAANDVDKATGAMTASFGRLAGVLAASFSVAEFVKLTDTFSGMNAQLKLVTDNVGELARVEQRLFEISQANRVGFESTVQLYARIARSTETLGVSQDKVLRVTDTINKALVISGTSAEQASGALMQLGQAFASGALRGDELNSILEGMPRVAQAIAEGMGITVGQLRALGAEGKLTSEAAFNALLKMSKGIDEEFGKMPTTVGQSLTVVSNSALRMIGVFDQANNVSAGFANAIMGLARTMDGAGGSVRSLLNAAMALGGGFAAYRLTLLAATGAQSAYTAAMVIGTRAIGAAQAGTLGLNAALAMNPFTAVAAAVGVLAASFIALGNAQAQARAETDNLIRSLDAAIKARGADVGSARAQADVERQRAQARLDVVNAERARLAGPRGLGGGNRALDLEAQELTWKVIELEGTVRLADRTLNDMAKTTADIKVPTAQAATAVSGLGNAARVAGGQASAAADDFQRLYDRLFPYEAAMRQLDADAALIRSNKALTDARKEEMLAALEQERFRGRTSGLGKATVSSGLLSTGSLMDAKSDLEETLDDLADKSKTQTVTIADTFAQMSQRITSSLQGLANSIRGGDFLGILGGVLDIFTQLGSAGAFGKGLQTRLNARSFDGGGFTGNGSRSGGLDGKGGFMAMLHPNETVIDHHRGQRLAANDTNVNVTVGIDPRSGNVLAFVDGRIAATAPLVANAGAQQAQVQAAASARRRVR